MQTFYQFADLFFFVFHTAVVLFNILGWVFKRTRFYNLVTLMLTACSWFILGIWYGWGYCLCTDWHWDVRDKLGYQDNTNSYIDLLVIKLTGIEFDDRLIDAVTVIVFAISIIGSVWLNIRDYKLKNKAR